MSESFGARLRRQREQQNITLATIAEQTKIKLSLLDALERDDVSHWPAGIFRRAYVRAYADAIGMSPDAVLREFLELYPEPAEDLDTISAVAMAGDATRAGGPPTRLRYIFGSALSRFRRSPVKDTPAPFEPCPELTESAAETLHVYHADAIADDSAVSEPPRPGPDLIAVAQLCTELARVATAGELKAHLGTAVALLDATGLVLWLWDPSRAELRAALAHGYSERVLAQLPGVARDADNATATAFRSAQMCVVTGTDHTSGALAVPLAAPDGCTGVLAIELPHGGEQGTGARAVATIVAAMLAQLVGGQAAEADTAAAAASQ